MINISKIYALYNRHFSSGVSHEDQIEFEDDINIINVSRAKLTSVIFIISEIFLIISSFIIKKSKIFEKHNINYIVMYSILLIAMVIFYLIFSYYSKNITDHRVAIRNTGIVFTSTVLLWCAVISLLDQASNGQILVYTVAVIAISVSPFLKPAITLSMYLCVQTVFLFLTPYFAKPGVSFFGNSINSTVFVIISWSISCMRYKKQSSAFNNKKIIEKQNEELQQINMELEEANKKLEILSQTDALTGIANRFMFNKSIEIEWNRCKRQFSPLSMLMIDIDFFKSFNDHYGHPAGDECLRQVAGVLSSNAKRSSDMVARYGGEEFVILLPYIEKEHAFSIAEKIRSTVEELNILHNYSEIAKHVTISIGVHTVVPSNEETVKEFIKKADVALYQAKIHRNKTIAA